MPPEAMTEPRIAPEKIEPWIGREVGSRLWRSIRNKLAVDPAFRERCQRRQEELDRLKAALESEEYFNSPPQEGQRERD